MIINQDIRNIFQTRLSDFDELENHYQHLNERFYSRSISHARNKSPLGDNCVNYLLSTLVRSISLIAGFGTNLNNQYVLSTLLIIRAHYEITGALAYFVARLKEYINNECSEIDFSGILRRMTLGMKKMPAKTEPNYSRVPLIINVLDYIDEADNFINKNFRLKKRSPFRSNYDILSEHCHPNAFGLMIGRTIKGRTISYECFPKLSDKEMKIILPHLLLSALLFLILYNQGWDIVSKSFTLPELEK